MKRVMGSTLIAAVIFSCLLFLPTHAFAGTIAFLSFSGNAIQSGDDPGFFPSGTATFDITDDTLTITLTNTTGHLIRSNWQAWSGLTWDMESGSLTPDRVIASSQADPSVAGPINMSTEWGYRSDLNVGSSPAGPIGSYGVSSVDSVNFTSAYGPGDRFDNSGNLYSPPPNGALEDVDGAIVGFNFDPTMFSGPVAQPDVTITFHIDSPLSGIDNIQPHFGRYGAFLVPVPEPSFLLLLSVGLGAVGLVVYHQKRK